MTVQPIDSFTPYSTVTGMAAELPNWMDQQDAERITAYQIYEQIYWGVPNTFALVQRGSDDSPIYIPNARTIVDTTSRFLAPSPGFVMDPDAGEKTKQETGRLALRRLLKRERFWSKYTSNKWYGVIRGDWMWHLIANPAKEPGKRIKIEAIDPACYFPVTHPDDPDRIIAVHIVEEFIRTIDGEAEGEVVIKRQTYMRGEDPVENDGSDERIFNFIALYSKEDWKELDSTPLEVIREETPLDESIKSIPVYHIKHRETPGDMFGSSELRGFERIMAAINQAVSDEELSLALDGLGMYATDGGPPRDETGAITNWMLGPGRVVEHPLGSKFERVTGVQSIAPVQDHLKFLIGQLKEASATPDAAVGKVDVQVAESGISLMLQLGPLLAKVGSLQEIITDVHDQMFFDLLNMWLPAYEGIDCAGTAAVLVVGSPIPEDKDALIKEILDLVDKGIVSAEWARDQIAELRGYDFGVEGEMENTIRSEMQARAKAIDPFASRMDAELNLDDNEGGDAE